MKPCTNACTGVRLRPLVPSRPSAKPPEGQHDAHHAFTKNTRTLVNAMRQGVHGRAPQPRASSPPSASPPEGHARRPPSSLDNHKKLGEAHAAMPARTCTCNGRWPCTKMQQARKHDGLHAISIITRALGDTTDQCPKSTKNNQLTSGSLSSGGSFAPEPVTTPATS